VSILSACDYLDNAWSVVQQRADKAGEELARTLLARIHGNRFQIEAAFLLSFLVVGGLYSFLARVSASWLTNRNRYGNRFSIMWQQVFTSIWQQVFYYMSTGFTWMSLMGFPTVLCSGR
jgi:hypothetical protein